MKTARWMLLGSAIGAGGYWLTRYLQPEHSPLILNGSVVLITGASSGIGVAFADAFARRGARVVLAARRVEKLDAVRQQIEPYAADVLVVPTDVSDETQLKALVDKTLNEFGRIDVLVNNAGLGAGGPLHTIPASHTRDVINVNLTAAMVLASHCLPSMLARRSGTIVNIASIFARIDSPNLIPYITSKRGLMGFSTALRREVEGTGVRVVAVLPYWTKSEMISPELEANLAASGTRLHTPEYVAERTIDGILKRKSEIVFGDLTIRTGMWLESHFPALMDLYWRVSNSPQRIAASRE